MIAKRVLSLAAIDRDRRREHHRGHSSQGAAAFQHIVDSEQIDVHASVKIFFRVGADDRGQQIDHIGLCCHAPRDGRGIGNIAGDGLHREGGVDLRRIHHVGQSDLRDRLTF